MEKEKDWKELALGCQDAGADFVETNSSSLHGYPGDTTTMAIGQSVENSARVIGWLKNDPRITTPIIPKLTAAVADISQIGQTVSEAGADAISGINSFPSLLGFDLETLAPLPSVGGESSIGGFSGPGLKPIALYALNRLINNPGLPIIAGGGIFSGYDAADFILLGASLLQVCTAAMVKGYPVISLLLEELQQFMEYHDFTEVLYFGTRFNSLSDANGDCCIGARLIAS